MDNMKKEDEYWFPKACNTEDNEHGFRYELYWDHIGDAYEEYEKLADDYLNMRKEIIKITKGVINHSNDTVWCGEVETMVEAIQSLLDVEIIDVNGNIVEGEI